MAERATRAGGHAQRRAGLQHTMITRAPRPRATSSPPQLRTRDAARLLIAPAPPPRASPSPAAPHAAAPSPRGRRARPRDRAAPLRAVPDVVAVVDEPAADDDERVAAPAARRGLVFGVELHRARRRQIPDEQLGRWRRRVWRWRL